MHRYVDSLLQCVMYHTHGGAEPFDDWIRRGPDYHFDGPEMPWRTVHGSCQLEVYQSLCREHAHQVMLFSHWKSADNISQKYGRIWVQQLVEL